MTFLELMESKPIPLGAILAFAIIEIIMLIYRRSIRNRNNKCEECERWECEGKWCFYTYKKEREKENK